MPCINNSHRISPEFGFAHLRCKARMVKTYGTSFYGSCLWDLFGLDFQKGFTTWYIAMRIILELLNIAHSLNHIHHILKCCFIKFMQSLSDSTNNKLVHLYSIYHKNKHSTSGINIARISCEYSVKFCDIQQCNMLKKNKKKT